MVKQNLSDIFIEEIYSKPVWKKHDTNKTVIKRVDITWSLESLDMIEWKEKTVEARDLFQL